MKNIILKRAYEDATDKDGYRILVDRLWPRGVSKEKAHLDEWIKEVAPTAELRKWFGHKTERFQEFKKRYKAELKEHTEELKHIREIAQKQQVCLVFGAKDEEHNQAVILKSVLEDDAK